MRYFGKLSLPKITLPLPKETPGCHPYTQEPKRLSLRVMGLKIWGSLRLITSKGLPRCNSCNVPSRVPRCRTRKLGRLRSRVYGWHPAVTSERICYLRTVDKVLRYTFLLALIVASALPAQAAIHVCILRGAGGEARYDERFQQWSDRLARVLVEQCGVAPEHVRALPPDSATAPLTRESAAAVMAELATAIPSTDTLFVVLIGHGSMQLEPKFMVSGPDISAADVKDWLDAIPATRQVIVNTASASAAFINALSRPERIVVTSTRGGDQPNATEFMEHFLKVLEEGRGDQNRDGQLTLAELCDAASASTTQWYETEDFVVTENALLDDNGDALGSRLPLAVDEIPKDGAVANALVLRRDPAAAGADPAKYAAYREAIAAVEAWKASKSTVDEATYWNKLEELLLHAARLNRDLSAVPPAAQASPPVLPPVGG